MPDSDDSQKVNCPVCRRHTPQEALQAQGVVLSGVEAYLGGNGQVVEDVYRTLNRYDAHTAITMYSLLLLEFSGLLGLEVEDLIAHYRKQLNDAQAATV